MLSQGLQTCKTKRRSSCRTPGSLDANLSIMFAQEAVKYTQEKTLSSSSSLESKQRSPPGCSSSRELPYQAFERTSSKVHCIDESDLPIRVVVQNVAKYTKETTRTPVLLPGVETKRRSSGSSSSSREAGQRRGSREAVHFTDMSIMLAQAAVKYNQASTPMSSQGFILETKPRQRSRSRSTSREAGQQRSSCEEVRCQRHSSREAVRFTGKSNLSIMLDQDSQDHSQEAVKYTQETTLNFSSSLETKHRSSRSTSREAARLPYRHRSSRAMHVTDKSELSILAEALDVAKYTQETTRMSSPGVETKLRSSRSTSREAGQRRSSLKQRSPRSASHEAESAEILYQHRGRSGCVHFHAYESDLSIMTRDVNKGQRRSSLKQRSPHSASREAESAEILYQHSGRSSRVHFGTYESKFSMMTRDVNKYTEETTCMSSPGRGLETKRRSSHSTSLEAGHRCSSREAVHFTGESDLSIMLALEAVKYSQESTLTKQPPQRFLAKIWGSLFKTMTPAKK